MLGAGTAAESASAIGRVLESLPEGRFFVQDDNRLRALVERVPHGRGIVWSTSEPVPEDTQVMPDIEAALQYAHRNGITERSSYVGLISGSSRTADIEKILVQGAHGPRRLVIVMERV